MKKLFAPSNHYLYLALFRVYLALHVLQKLFFFIGHSDLLFGNSSFVKQYNTPFFALFGLHIDFFKTHHGYFLIAFLIVALAVLFGIGRHFSILLMYIFLEIFQRMNHLILNGGDNLLKFLILYMIFADSFRHFTLYKSKKAGLPASETANLLTNLAVLSVKIHLCLIYFISGIFKANTKLWFSGIATYYTLLNERFEGTGFNKHIVQSGLLVSLSTYFVMLWEIFFPFLVNTKKLRLFTLISGIFIHMGIFVFMMIYDFEVLFVACYGFFYSDDELIAAYNKIKSFLARIKAGLLTRPERVVAKKAIANN